MFPVTCKMPLACINVEMTTEPLVADIRAGSLSDFDRVLREIRMIDGVSNSETSLLLSSV